MKKFDYMMEYMNWPTVRSKIDAGADTVIICTASIEQHGYHLSESTDPILGEAMALLVAEKLGNALIAPIIRPGLSEHHMPMAGSITLRPEIYHGIIEDYVTSLKRHGFKQFILFSSHGGNFSEDEKIYAQLKTTHPELTFIRPLSFEGLVGLMAAFESAYQLPAGSCGHAGAFETSVMLAEAPEQVQMSKAAPGYVGQLDAEAAKKMFASGIVGLTEVGVLGNPLPAKAAYGTAFLEKVTDDMVKKIQEVLKV
ncbi:MAG: creatinine amidohydrolase [Clostridiales bacterium]|nr:creatinine amidohydrolase [Clostridiales bacterium]